MKTDNDPAIRDSYNMKKTKASTIGIIPDQLAKISVEKYPAIKTSRLIASDK